MEKKMIYETPFAEVFPIAMEQCILNKASGEDMDTRDEPW